jgi:HSP20 family protein
MTTEMTRFSPFEELRTVNKMMDRMMQGSPWWPSVPREDVDLSAIDRSLPVDIYEQDEAIVVKAALPGVDPKDIDVSINDGILRISAETKSEDDVDEGDYHRREYRYGKWFRSFRLPNSVDADNTKAAFEHGMLRLTIPYSEETSARAIKIDVS